MTGMGSGSASNNSVVVAAFHNALLHQGLVVTAILVVVLVAWNVTRIWQFRLATGATPAPAADTATLVGEPVARRLLRVSFGLIWIFDGILQGQAGMPLGLIPNVVTPAASSSPSWVRHLVGNAAQTWNFHPVAAAAAAVWIQVGIGLFLLVAPRGTWSRLAGVASCGWGLVVWVCGEAFGGIFAPGLTWLFGAPGAVLFYVVAGALVALPEIAWQGPQLGRTLLRVLGLFFAGMAVLQAWPGRGFWQGQTHSGAPGTLTGMVQQMAQTPQPSPLKSAVSWFAGFDAAHGWAVNLVAVIALASIGTGLIAARRPWTELAVAAATVVCLADWVLIEDFGFFGGVGTDPNSMIPMALLVIAAWLAVIRPAPAPEPTVVPISAGGATAAPPRWRERLTSRPAYTFRVTAALGSVAVVLIGAAPMAAAATNRHPDPILTAAIDGPVQSMNVPAPSFALIDQNGQPVSSASLRGKAVVITFLDPVCTSDCPVIASELKLASLRLHSQESRVEFVAIDANPRYTTTDYLAAFTRQEDLQSVPNWLYLTGSLPQLQAVWKAYGVDVEYAPGGAMVLHSEVAFVIDPAGRIRDELNTDPGPATSATTASFAGTVAATLVKALGGR